MVRYESGFFCPTTQKRLRSNDLMCSQGVCPHCGHIEPGTITHSVKKSRRVEYSYRLWGLIEYVKEVGEWNE